MNRSRKTLLIISALVWYCGVAALLLKGGALFKAAHFIAPQSQWTYVAVLLGIGTGLVKAKFIFRRSCERNIQRIRSLQRPRIWQSFRPGLLLFLVIIIPSGAWMSKRVAGSHTLLCLVGALDLSIACALLASSLAYWHIWNRAPLEKADSHMISRRHRGHRPIKVNSD